MIYRCLRSMIVFQLTLLAGCASPLKSQGMPLASPTLSITVSPEVMEIEVLVYFTSTTRYAPGIQPFETPVTRRVPMGSFLPQAVLEEFFKGTIKIKPL